VIGILLLAVLAAACQESTEVQPTHIPTRIPPTPTIRSTPLPGVPKAPALGEGDQRQIVIQIALFGENAKLDAQRTANQLQQALQDDLDLDIRVEFTDEDTALERLCSGAPYAAWVSPFTMVKAQTECGAVPVLAVTRGRSPRATIGTTAEIIARVDITALSQLRGRVFCRSYDQDYFTSWVFPSLFIASQGVNPITGLSEIKDYPDNLSMARAFYAGDCAAAALPPDEFEDLLIALSADLSTEEEPVTSSELADVIHVVQSAGNTSLNSNVTFVSYGFGVIPYEVLVFPPDSAIPATLRKRTQDDDPLGIADIIESFLTERDTGTQRVSTLLDATGIIAVNPVSSYQNFSPTVVRAKWDMTFSD
jgi:hypothetical protein